MFTISAKTVLFADPDRTFGEVVSPVAENPLFLRHYADFFSNPQTFFAEQKVLPPKVSLW